VYVHVCVRVCMCVYVCVSAQFHVTAAHHRGRNGGVKVKHGFSAEGRARDCCLATAPVPVIGPFCTCNRGARQGTRQHDETVVVQIYCMVCLCSELNL